MIDPLTIMAGMQAVGGFIDAQNKYKDDEARYQQNRINAVASRDLKISSLNKRAIQEAEAASGQKLELALAALKERESRKVVDSGLEGQTEQLKLGDVTARKLRSEDVITSNVDAIMSQIEDQAAGYDAEAVNRINSIPRGQKPSPVAHALNAAASMYATELDVTGNKLFDLPFGGGKLNKALPNTVMPTVPSLGTTRFSSLAGTSDFGYID